MVNWKGFGKKQSWPNWQHLPAGTTIPSTSPSVYKPFTVKTNTSLKIMAF
jgi:hypothetical protein